MPFHLLHKEKRLGKDKEMVTLLGGVGGNSNDSEAELSSLSILVLLICNSPQLFLASLGSYPRKKPFTLLLENKNPVRLTFNFTQAGEVLFSEVPLVVSSFHCFFRAWSDNSSTTVSGR
jgi:hypothetical protein